MDLSSFIPAGISTALSDALARPGLIRFLFIVKVFSGIVSLALLAGIVYLIVKMNYLGQRMAMLTEAKSKKAFVVPKQKTAKKLAEIQRKVSSEYEADYKLALLEADKFFDESLKLMGLEGKDMADRLKYLNKEQLKSIEDVWWAHKLRNRMVHESHFKLSHADAQRAVGIFSRAMSEFEGS